MKLRVYRDASAPLALADHRLRGQQRIGGQEHFYLEGQIAMALPGEGREMVEGEVEALLARLRSGDGDFVAGARTILARPPSGTTVALERRTLSEDGRRLARESR